MQKSTAVEQAMLRFYDRFSAGDVDGFAQMITAWQDTFIIGTDPGEWQDGRTTWIAVMRNKLRPYQGFGSKPALCAATRRDR